MALRRSNEAKRGGFLGFVRTYWSHLWRTLVTGLLVWVPLIITVWLTWLFVSKFVFGVDLMIRYFVEHVVAWGKQKPHLAFLESVRYIRGSGILIVAALFLTTGLLTRHFVGRRIIAIGERVVQVIPLVNRVYRAVQQIRDVFVGRQGAVFQKVCLVEYPRKDMIAVAFVTSGEQGLVQRAVGKELVAVFVPTTPNPTSGYLVYLSPEEVRPLDITVEEAMKLIVSGGAYIPGQGPPPEDKEEDGG